MLDERKNAAKMERANDHVARDAKEGIVQANRAARAKQQAARYVPALEVESLLSHPDASDTFRRVFGLGGRQGKVILPLPLSLYPYPSLPLPLSLTLTLHPYPSPEPNSNSTPNQDEGAAHVAQTNAELTERIKNIAPRTDYGLQDEDIHLERLRIREEHAEKKRKEVSQLSVVSS